MFNTTFSTIAHASVMLLLVVLLVYSIFGKGETMEISNHRPLSETQTDSVSLLDEEQRSEAAFSEVPPDENPLDEVPLDDVKPTNGEQSDEPQADEKARIVHMSPRDLGSSPFDDIVNPPATQEEKDALTQSVREFGILNPLIVWGNSGKSKPPVLAGNRRLATALALDLDSVPVISRDFDSREKAKQFAIRENTERREMTPIARTMAADELWCLFDKATDKKAKAAEGLPPRKRAALAAGIGEGTLAAFRYVKETADDAIIIDMLSGKIAIHAAYKQAKVQVEGVPVTGGKSTGSVKTDKALDHLKEVSGFLKGLTKLSEQIATGIPNAAGRIKVADKRRIAKELGDAQDFLAKVRNDDFLGALEKAIETAKSSVS